LFTTRGANVEDVEVLMTEQEMLPKSEKREEK